MSLRKNHITVQSTADFDTIRAADGDTIQTLGYHVASPGVGAGLYIYRAVGKSGVTVDDGFFFAGAGPDDYIELIDKTEANMTQFGYVPGSGDDAAPILRKAMAVADVYFPPGNYNFDSFVNLKSDRYYRGAGGRRSILRRTGTQRHIFAISTYDFEAFNESLFVEHKRNIEIYDLCFDWYFQSGWVDFAACIQLKGTDTGNSDEIRNIKIHHCIFIDSFNVPHSGSDAWAINYAAFAPIQSGLYIEDNRMEQEGHQFGAGGGGGWNHVRIRRNYAYHPHANGITLSTASPANVSFKDVQITENQITGPYGLGIWVGPDQVSGGGIANYTDINICDNKITYDAYSGSTSLGGIRINVFEGKADNILISDNTVIFEDTFPASGAALGIILANGGERSLSTTANYTQPGSGGSVTITINNASGIPVGSVLSVNSGGLYRITGISSNNVTGTLIGEFHNFAGSGTTVTSGKSVNTRGDLENAVIQGNLVVNGRIYCLGTKNCIIDDNKTQIIQLDSTNEGLTISNNTLQRLSNACHVNGVVHNNRFMQFDDSGGLGNISILPATWNGFTNTDSLIYSFNVLANVSNTLLQSRFIYEAGTGNFAGEFYGNISRRTSGRGLTLSTYTNRRGSFNVHDTANVNGMPSSIANIRYFTATLDFDLSSNISQTLTFSAPGATVNGVVLVSVPSNAVSDLVGYSAYISSNDTIRVTANRLVEASGVNPPSATFQFIYMEPR